jgi:hypothetical protein
LELFLEPTAYGILIRVFSIDSKFFFFCEPLESFPMLSIDFFLDYKETSGPPPYDITGSLYFY